MSKMANTIEFDVEGYEDAFPFEQEYQMWIESMERDFEEECLHRIAVKQGRDNVIIDSEDLSPFATINS